MTITKHTRRGAYTLIELLVVLSIIAVLAALTAAAVMRFSTTGPAVATRANLGKIRALLGTQWRGVVDESKTESMSAAGNAAFLTQAQSLTGISNAVDPRVKAKYLELKLIQAFPTKLEEVYLPGNSATLQYRPYIAFLNQPEYGITSGNYTSVPQESQSAICLLMILEKGPKNSGVTADDLGISAVGPVLLDATRRAPGIVDGWRKPVLFTRTFNGQANAPALLSAGADEQFGVNPTTFQTTDNSQVRDNVLVEKP